MCVPCRLGILFSSLFCYFSFLPATQQTVPAIQQEEALDYFSKWIEEDVVYIVSDEERSVFQKLTTLDEKEQFIEQFWFRRDPDPTTAANEFKEEHYRRVAYANDEFASGLPGWRTDRGRIYIVQGPPDEVEHHPTGGTYDRPMSEGGGSTTTFPYEVWRYRHIEGLGDDIILEFVDKSLAGEYKLARRPEEKDALLYVPGGGATMAERMGYATKADRPFFSPGNLDSYPMMHYSANDSLFRRYELYARIQRPGTFKYDDLKEMVKVNIEYNNLPFSVQEDYFQLSENRVLAPVTVEIENRLLTYRTEGDLETARLGVYGVVTTLSNRLAYEFEDDVVIRFGAEDLRDKLSGRSLYQRIVPLDTGLRCKLDLVVKDLNSQKVGAVRRALVPPAFDPERLTASSLVLSNSIRIVDSTTDDVEMFVLGDVKIHPSLAKNFVPEIPLGIYFQLYNVAIDESSSQPALDVTYRVSRNGSVVGETRDSAGESTHYFSNRRTVILKLLGLAGLESGKYEIEVEVSDRLSNQSLKLKDQFTFDSRDEATHLISGQ